MIIPQEYIPPANYPDLKYKNHDDKECPLCRTINNISNIKDIKGLEEECKICFSEPIQKFFGKCGHAVVCNNCFTKL